VSLIYTLVRSIFYISIVIVDLGSRTERSVDLVDGCLEGFYADGLGTMDRLRLPLLLLYMGFLVSCEKVHRRDPYSMRWYAEYM
jgi:hypothetical protein